jgi:predicted ester cyclase
METPVLNQPTLARTEFQRAHRATAVRFIEAFNTEAWDVVHDVVADNFTFHHPIGGTVEAGPEGMVATWAGFKRLSPDSWHPIPILISEGDYAAVLLPTYGTFTGRSDQAPPPTGGRLDYGMVNIVRFEAGRLAEMWFGMDPLVELAQMGVLPGFAPQPSSPLCAHAADPEPPYGGDPSVDTAASRAVVSRFFGEVLRDHRLELLHEIVTPDLLVHPTAMPGEVAHRGTAGLTAWLAEQWAAFPDLTVRDCFTVASGDIAAVRWQASGTSRGPFMGIAPTGSRVHYTGLSMYRLDGGRIAEIWETRNSLAILHQLDPRIGGGHRH